MAIELFSGTDNDITINIPGITNITSMDVQLIRKNDNVITTITSGSGKITFTVDGSDTSANMRIDKTLLVNKGIYYLATKIISGGSTRGLKLDPTFLTVI